MKDKNFKPLDNEEAELMREIDNNEWVSEKARKSITLRIPNADLEAIKSKAESLGLPYQTLIASVLHRYAVGSIEVKEAL